MGKKGSVIKLVKKADVYCPEPIGEKDVLIAGDRIAEISDSIDLGIDINIIDGKGKFLVPGFIDNHVHITGGGGEGGYQNRTPEIKLTDITMAGVTTIVGCLGTDGYSRTVGNLLAKAYALEEEGITTYVYTGNYRVPLKTLTGSVVEDLLYLEKVIGAGEVALSDHRSSQPTIDELKRLAADTRVGGILSGKAGVVNFHIGNSSKYLQMIETIVETSELPYTQFLPTHVGRSPELIAAAINFAKKGGMVDLTTSTEKVIKRGETSSASQVFKYMLDNGGPAERISFSSDGQGSLPVFDENGKFLHLGVGKVTSLFNEFRKSVLNESISIEDALKPVTINPAKYLKLKGKGRIEENSDADLLLLNKESLDLDTVIAKGKIMVSSGKAVVKGTFE